MSLDLFLNTPASGTATHGVFNNASSFANKAQSSLPLPAASTAVGTGQAPGGINGDKVNNVLGGVWSHDMTWARNAGNSLGSLGGNLGWQVNNTMRATSAMVDDALSYNSQARRDAEAASAAAAARSAIERQTDANKRDAMRMGVNPNSGRFAALGSQNVVNGALAEVTAANNARRAVEDAGFNRLAEVSKQGIALTQPTLAAYAGQLDANRFTDGVRQADNDTSYRWEALDRQTQQNAAELALRKYATEKGISLENSKLDRLDSQAKANAWNSGLSLAGSFLGATGLGSKVGDWIGGLFD